MIAILLKDLCFRAPLLSFTYCGVVTVLHLRCLKYSHAALKMFKIHDSNTVDSSDDEVDYLSESSHSEDN